MNEIGSGVCLGSDESWIAVCLDDDGDTLDELIRSYCYWTRKPIPSKHKLEQSLSKLVQIGIVVISSDRKLLINKNWYKKFLKFFDEENDHYQIHALIDKFLQSKRWPVLQKIGFQFEENEYDRALSLLE